MSARFGRCRNLDYCSLAVQGAVLRLGPDELFVCPECARPLAGASAWKRGGSGHAALLRLAPPLGITAIGLGAIALGVWHNEGVKAPTVKHVVVATAKPAAHPAPRQAAAVAPPKLAAPHEVAAVMAPLKTVVVLRVAATAPLNASLLPGLAASYLAGSSGTWAVVGTEDGVGHAVVTKGGENLDIQVTEAPFDPAAFAAGQTDMLCSPDEPLAAQLQAAGPLIQQRLGDMAAAPYATIMCYARPVPQAEDFLAFLAKPESRQTVASAGYDFRPEPAPEPTPAPGPAPGPAPLAAPTKTPPHAKAVAARPAVSKTASARVAMVKPPPAKQPAAKPAPETAAPAASAADSDASADADGAAPPPGPRKVYVPAGSPLTLDALKAMTTPDKPTDNADSGDATPHHRNVYLPAEARIAYGTYQPLKMPEQPAQLIFVKPGAVAKAGSMKVDCNIGTDGVPADCKEISHQGTAEAAAAILAWLPSGAIRYAPVVKEGRTVAERRVITVNFGGH
jgi:hypothetical protein